MSNLSIDSDSLGWVLIRPKYIYIYLKHQEQYSLLHRRYCWAQPMSRCAQCRVLVSSSILLNSIYLLFSSLLLHIQLNPYHFLCPLQLEVHCHCLLRPKHRKINLVNRLPDWPFKQTNIGFSHYRWEYIIKLN